MYGGAFPVETMYYRAFMRVPGTFPIARIDNPGLSFLLFISVTRKKCTAIN